MKTWHVIAVGLVAAVYLLTRPPSAGKVVSGMDIDLDSGTIRYGEDVFATQWGEPQSRSGVVRHLARAHDKLVPIVLWHLVLTTGEFSDPEIVTIDYSGGGNYFWRAAKQPEGSLIVLHLVPESETALRSLKAVDVGDRVEIFGRDETRGSIERQNGGFLRLGHDNHRFVLVSRAAIEP